MPILDNASRTTLGGIPLVCLSASQMAEALLEDAQSRTPDQSPRLISSANGNVIAHFARNSELREAMGQMDAINPDGMPLVMVSRFLGQNRLPGRVATTDFFHDAARVAQEDGLSFFMFGATEQENFRATEMVRKLYPNLRIAGRHHGYISEADEPALVDEIRKSGTDILWVALSVPLAQAFMVRNRERLRGLVWVKSCGGLFNFLSGKNRRAPAWMQRVGLEWLYRASLEPRRLGPRYISTNIEAVIRLIFPPEGKPVFRGILSSFRGST